MGCCKGTKKLTLNLLCDKLVIVKGGGNWIQYATIRKRLVGEGRG